MKTTLLFALLGLMAAPAYAGTTTCSNPTGELRYETYNQEGGPCCGRSSTTLTWKGQVVKQTQVVMGWGGNPGSSSDSNPSLTISEGNQIDLGNSGKDGIWAYVNYATNLTITTDAPVAHGNWPIGVFSVVCTSTHSTVPIP